MERAEVASKIDLFSGHESNDWGNGCRLSRHLQGSVAWEFLCKRGLGDATREFGAKVGKAYRLGLSVGGFDWMTDHNPTASGIQLIYSTSCPLLHPTKVVNAVPLSVS